jgi:hypothetical protein
LFLATLSRSTITAEEKIFVKNLFLISFINSQAVDRGEENHIKQQKLQPSKKVRENL